MKLFNSKFREKKSEVLSRDKDKRASGKNKKKTYTGNMKLIGFGDLRRSLGD